MARAEAQRKALVGAVSHPDGEPNPGRKRRREIHQTQNPLGFLCREHHGQRAAEFGQGQFRGGIARQILVFGQPMKEDA